MVWIYGVGIADFLLHVVIDVMRFIAYDDAWTKKKDTTTAFSNNDKKVRDRVIKAIDNDVTMDFAALAVATIVWMLHGDNWLWAQLENLPEEEFQMHMDEVDAELAKWEEDAAAKAGAESGDMEEAEEEMDEVAEEEFPEEEEAAAEDETVEEA